MKKLNIYFDMDGTIADLYGFKNWLNLLQAENVTPYENCEPMVDMLQLAELLKDSRINANIISWTSKYGSSNYNKRTRYAKIRWLRKHGLTPYIKHYYIVPYGTIKNDVLNRPLTGLDILVDDEQYNQLNWLSAGGSIISEKNILNDIKKYLDFIGQM